MQWCSFSLLVKTFWPQIRGTIPLFPRALATHATPLFKSIFRIVCFESKHWSHNFLILGAAYPWSPKDLTQAKGIMTYNLAAAYAIRGDYEKASLYLSKVCFAKTFFRSTSLKEMLKLIGQSGLHSWICQMTVLKILLSVLKVFYFLKWEMKIL